jgi:tRNA modification GTPase
VVLVLVAPSQLAETHNYLEESGLMQDLSTKQTILVTTKSDQTQDAPSKPEWASQVVQVSAQTGDGMESLQKALIGLADVHDTPGDVVLTTKRQLELATLAKGHTTQVITLLGSGAPRDIVLVELESAAKQLTRITGADTNDAMIADMFSRFCIGK